MAYVAHAAVQLANDESPYEKTKSASPCVKDMQNRATVDIHAKK